MKTGIYPDMPMAEYLSIKALSSGVCHTILAESPMHALYRQQYPRESSEESDIGTAFHDAFLEGVDRIVEIDAKDWRTNAAKDARDAARAQGKIPMLAHKVGALKTMIESARNYLAQSELPTLMQDGKPELTLIWKENDILCKARPDFLKTDGSICLSVKTTKGSANPESWIRTQLPLYDTAAAFYEAGIRATYKIEHTRVVHFVIEQMPPYSCSLIALDPAWQALAQQKLSIALAIWQRCIETGKYPAYPTQIAYAEPKPWMLAEAEEQELENVQLSI